MLKENFQRSKRRYVMFGKSFLVTTNNNDEKTIVNFKHWAMVCQHLAMVNKIDGYETYFGLLTEDSYINTSYGDLKSHAFDEPLTSDDKTGLSEIISKNISNIYLDYPSLNWLENLQPELSDIKDKDIVIAIVGNAEKLLRNDFNEGLFENKPFYDQAGIFSNIKEKGESIFFDSKPTNIYYRTFHTKDDIQALSHENCKSFLFNLIEYPFADDKPTAQKLLNSLKKYLQKDQKQKNQYVLNSLVDLLFEYSLKDKSYDPISILMNDSSPLAVCAIEHLLTSICERKFITPVDVKKLMAERYLASLDNDNQLTKEFCEKYFEMANIKKCYYENSTVLSGLLQDGLFCPLGSKVTQENANEQETHYTTQNNIT